MGERIGTGILERGLVDRRIGVFVTIGDVEVLGQAAAVVGADEVTDDLRQVVFFRQFQSVGHVVDDDLCTLFVVELVVRIDTGLVFGEERRIQHLADVVIHGSGTHQLAVGPDAVGGGRREVGQLQGVLEGARRHF